MNSITSIPINWQLKFVDFNDEKKCLSSKLKLSAEWDLECLWTTSLDPIPEIIQIRRKSTTEEVTIFFSISVMLETHLLERRKISDTMEFGKSITLVHLLFSSPGLPGNYIILGDLTFPAEVSCCLNEEDPKEVQFRSLQILSNDFELLLDSKLNLYSDVNFKCGTDSFPVHKNIISARSPVFYSMFATEMKENRDNEVDITDISPHVLKSMLTYIYTGKTGELTYKSAGELLFAADKYQLLDLKSVCSNFLKSCASADNVLNILVLGYFHDVNLKDFAIDFICYGNVKFAVLEETTDWKNLRESKPDLVMEILINLVKSKDEMLRRRKTITE